MGWQLHGVQIIFNVLVSGCLPQDRAALKIATISSHHLQCDLLTLLIVLVSHTPLKRSSFKWIVLVQRGIATIYERRHIHALHKHSRWVPCEKDMLVWTKRASFSDMPVAFGIRPKIINFPSDLLKIRSSIEVLLVWALDRAEGLVNMLTSPYSDLWVIKALLVCARIVVISIGSTPCIANATCRGIEKMPTCIHYAPVGGAWIVVVAIAVLNATVV
jgi:hypothetical protein